MNSSDTRKKLATVLTAYVAKSGHPTLIPLSVNYLNALNIKIVALDPGQAKLKSDFIAASFKALIDGIDAGVTSDLKLLECIDLILSAQFYDILQAHKRAGGGIYSSPEWAQFDKRTWSKFSSLIVMRKSKNYGKNGALDFFITLASMDALAPSITDLDEVKALEPRIIDLAKAGAFNASILQVAMLYLKSVREKREVQAASSPKSSFVARNALERALLERGINVRRVDGVLVTQAETKKGGSGKAEASSDSTGKPRAKTGDTHKILHLIDALAKQKGVVIGDVFAGDKPAGKRAPHYYIVTLEDSDTWFAIADGHLDYVSRGDLLPTGGITTQQLIDDKQTYCACPFNNAFISTWTSSLIRFGFVPTAVLGVQKKGKESWSESGISLLFAVKSFVEAEGRLPRHSDKIKSDDPRINRQPYRNSVTQCRRDRIPGLEGVRGVNDMFFCACQSFPNLRDAVEESFWTQRQVGTGKTGAQFEAEYLERLSGTALG